MKRLYFFMLWVLLACAPAAAFAAGEQAGEKAAPAGDAGQEDPGKQAEAPDLFSLGMSREDAQKAGAKPTDQPDIMTRSLSWKDAEWTAVLMFDAKGLSTIGLQTAIDNRVLMGVMESIKERNYKVLNVTGPDGKDVELYQLAAEGKDEAALDAAFDQVLGAFADAETGRFTAILCPASAFMEIADTVKTKGDEDDIMKKQGPSTIYAVQMDKTDDKLTVLISTFAAMSSQ